MEAIFRISSSRVYPELIGLLEMHRNMVCFVPRGASHLVDSWHSNKLFQLNQQPCSIDPFSDQSEKFDEALSTSRPRAYSKGASPLGFLVLSRHLSAPVSKSLVGPLPMFSAKRLQRRLRDNLRQPIYIQSHPTHGPVLGILSLLSNISFKHLFR